MTDKQQFEKLEIRRFRGLSFLELSGLGTLNILLGANDVGKTSVLEAILLVCNLSEPRLPVRVQNARNFGVQEIDDLSSVFFGLDSARGLSIAIYRGDSEFSKLSITAPQVDTPAIQKSLLRADTSNARTMGDVRSKGMDGESSFTVRDSRVLQYDVEVQSKSRQAPLTFSVRLLDHGDKWGVDKGDSNTERSDPTIPATFLGPSSGYDTDRIGRLVVEKKDDLLLKYLHVINSRAAKISVLGDVAYIDVGLMEMMPLNMFGSGMIRAATILSECILGEARVLLIDELEYGLHYQAIAPLLKAIINLAGELGIQVFATTHSLDVLRGLQQVLDHDEFLDSRSTTACFALQRHGAEGVRSYRYDYDQLDHCIKNEMEIR